MLGYIFRVACWAYIVEVTPGKVNINALVEAEPQDVTRSLQSAWRSFYSVSAVDSWCTAEDAMKPVSLLSPQLTVLVFWPCQPHSFQAPPLASIAGVRLYR